MIKNGHFFPVLAACIMFFACGIHGYAEESSLPGITVTGKAEIRLVPDSVDIIISVEKRNNDLWKAKKEHDDVLRKIEGVMKKHKIGIKQLKIDYLSIAPRYDNCYSKEKFLGFFVSRSMQLTLTDLSVFEGLLADLFTSGITSITGIRFKTTELEKQRHEAQRMAVLAAKEKAGRIAGELGFRAGRPISIVEETEGSSAWPYAGKSWVSNAVYSSPGEVSDQYGTLFPGEIPVSSVLRVTFEIVK
ncbi:MAG: SIMPL domain-containing protein [Spirochaetales bacterium]|nr:SIMPL domain-containing protein [Spirochaetales bacterium]